jgi:hypothetical protein
MTRRRNQTANLDRLRNLHSFHNKSPLCKINEILVTGVTTQVAHVGCDESVELDDRKSESLFH